MNTAQAGILATENALARYLSFSISAPENIPYALEALSEIAEPDKTVVGFGQSLVDVLGKEIPGLGTMAAQTHAGITIPSTPSAVWCWLRGTDRGEIYHRSRAIEFALAPAFDLDDVVDSFSFDQVRDLSGYEDGTENPQGDEAIEAAIVQGQGAGMNGSSFVAVQQWLHDLDTFESLTEEEQDDVFGRHHSTNEEFDEAPEAAHVKRAAQESFEPEAFVLRRSMPWAEGMNAGLVFVAFGHSFDAFEAILNRMIGKEDGITDNLFSFTRPITGAYYWCPPVKDGRLDFSLLGL